VRLAIGSEWWLRSTRRRLRPRGEIAKTYKNLYRRVHDWDNLYRAYRSARRGKRDTAQVSAFEFDYEGELLRLQEELGSLTYRRSLVCVSH